MMNGIRSRKAFEALAEDALISSSGRCKALLAIERDARANDVWASVERRLMRKYPQVKRIYFGRRGSDGAVKIGVSQQITVRRTNVSRAIGEDVELITWHVGDHALEKELHERFAHCRIKGEWFRPSPDLLDYIASVRGRQ